MAEIPSMRDAKFIAAELAVQNVKPRIKKPKKVKNKRVCQQFLDHRVKYLESNGWNKSKWIIFCEEMLRLGLVCELYEAQKTRSKYIKVRMPDDHSRSFKVRFSDHRPIKHRESAGDCDFFVGVTNFKTTTTQQAITATLEFFGVSRWPQ